MNVAQLRGLLATLPDDLPVWIGGDDPYEIWEASAADVRELAEHWVVKIPKELYGSQVVHIS